MEFTGERVIPGHVEPDLWAEHFSRYRFAASLAHESARPPDVLDIGCGSGYGTAALAEYASSATGIDLASEAIDYARAHYDRPGLTYLTGSATDLPFPAASFDLITAFEVIEHLNDPAKLLAEARRVLRPDGVFLVSTPNKTYYAETRRDNGPNPYHVHEFTHEEFARAVHAHFPSYVVLLQNHTDAFSFYNPTAPLPAQGYLETITGAASDAHFFLAVCSERPLDDLRNFVYVPAATNLLRTREHHIDILQREIENLKLSIDALKNSLATAHGERDKMIAMFDEQEHLLAERTEWAQRMDHEFNQKVAHLKIVMAELDANKRLAIERTQWAQQLEAELQKAYERMREARDSRWLRLGRKLNFGPQIEVPEKTGSPGTKPDTNNDV
jgi:ubiquinone/menaquinone biosynthesis C-methylase UbiE